MAFSLLSLSSSSPLFSSSDSSSLLFRTAINSTIFYRNNTNYNVYSSSDKYSCRLFNHPRYLSMSIGTEANFSGVSDKFLDATSDELEGDTDDEEEEEDSGGRVGFVETEEDAHEHDWGPSVLPDRWDVLGLGQAMVDFSGMVDDEFLDRLGLEKGTRKVVYHEERGRVLRAMDGCSYKAAAGGSLSNSLVALARLGGQPIGGPALNIAMTGSVGSDPLGGFYRSKLRRANVNFLSAPVKDGTTGTVIVLTTPDAQRTMLAYQGTSSRVHYDPCLASLVSKTRILIVEGYLFELPDTIKAIRKACEEARRCGALIAITASDVSCIERHYDDFWDIMANYADIVFANSDEARTFSHFSSKESPISAARNTANEMEIISSKSPEQISLLAESKRQEVIHLENEIVFNEAIIEERELGIREVQQQIGEVNEIFKDLAVLVHEQGALIDDINSNIEGSHAATAQATSQLTKAAKIQKSNSSMTCLMLLIVGIVLLIGVTVFVV